MIQTNLAGLRELSALDIPIISDEASAQLLSELSAISTGTLGACPTDFLGREHFDAYTAIDSPKSIASRPRQNSGNLFNQVIRPYDRCDDGFREMRLIFGLSATAVEGLTVIEPRSRVLLPYPDKTPTTQYYSQGRISSLAVQSAVEAGSFIELVRYGQEKQRRTEPKRPYTKVEQLAVAFAAHLQE